MQDHGTGQGIGSALRGRRIGSALAAERAGSARRRPRRLAVMAAAAVLALGAALLVPVSTVGAVGLPNGITGSWGTGANATTLTVSWTSPGGSYLEYDVAYRVDSGTVWDPSPSYPAQGWVSASSAIRTESTSIASLDSTQTYVAAVRARDRETGAYGIWAISGLIEPAGTPGRPVGMHETERKASPAELEVAWGKVTGAAGGYEIRVSEDTATKAWGAAKTVAQPASGSTVSAELGSANLPSGFATSKNYVAQVRSKSASGTCGSGGVLCSRWVQSGRFAQLDISGVDVTHVLPSEVPIYVENIAYDMRVDWDALPAELTSVSYQVRFYYRHGNPANHYISTDDNSAEHAIPDGWHQDWQWYSLCNDADATNDPDRGCARPCADSWSFDCERKPPYPKPPWWFNGGPAWTGWIDVASSACGTTTSNKRVCSYTFPLSAVDNGVALRARVRAVNGLTTGPYSEYATTKTRPPTQPSQVQICAPTGASVRVEWKRGFHNGAAITGYNIALTKAASGSNAKETTDISNTSGTVVSPDDPRRCDQSPGSTRYSHSHHRVFSYMFHGVETDRSYSAAVSAINSKGAGPSLGTGLVGLVPTAPPAPAPPTATVTATSATLTWEAPADNGGSAVTGYGVRFRAQNSDDTWPANWTVHTRTGAATSVTETVGSLTAGTTYQFQVQACNATGTGGATACGPWSAALEKATPSG